MSGFLKVMVALLLTLPLGAYVTGTLVASQAEMAPTRDPVVLEVSPAGGSPEASPTSGPTRDPDRRGREPDDDREVDEVRVVHPTPHDVDDDHGGDRDRDDRDETGDDRDKDNDRDKDDGGDDD